MCEPCNVLQSGPRFDFLQLFFPFGTYASRNRPCRPVPYGPMQRLCHPAHFFPFCCKSKLFNSKENCKSQIPDSLSCFSLWATRKRTNYTTALLPSQDPLQSSTAVDLVKLHASLLVVQDVHSTWPKVRKGNPPGSTNITSILFSNYISTKGNATTIVGMATIAIKTIELVSQPGWLADISVLVHPSREVRYDCSKPKENTCIQVVFTQSPVRLTTIPEYLPVSGFNVPSLHLSQSSRLHPFHVSQATAAIQVT